MKYEQNTRDRPMPFSKVPKIEFNPAKMRKEIHLSLYSAEMAREYNLQLFRVMTV